ncbi:MAG: TRAP transporter substrate-binding protein [Dorea sp.]|nr:TRAP transporter substrate-binding protein [Dorea sp.]
MKKRWISVVMGLLMVCCTTACQSGESKQSDETTVKEQGAEGDDSFADLSPVTVKMVCTSLEGEEPTPEMQRIAEEIEDKSGGKITFDITIGGSTLFGESEMYDMLRSGSIDMCNVAPTQFSDIAPEMSVCCWPYVFESADNINNFWTGESSQYLKDMVKDKSGIEILTTGFTGVRNVTTQGIEVRCPDDLDGVKIRCMDSKIYVDGTNAMGATAVPIAWSELYFALQTGVVQGQENANTVMEAGSLYEVQDTLSLTEHLYSMSTFAANGDFWDALPGEFQDLIRATFVEHFKAFPEKLQEENDKLLEKFKSEYDMKIVEDVDKQAFIDACGEEFMKEFGDDEAYVKMYDAIKECAK